MNKGLAVIIFALLLSSCGREEAAEQASAAAPPAGSTPASDPVALGVEAITEASYRRHVEILASDEFGGRAPGSPGEQLTVDYLVRNFEGLGLEHANSDSYIQDVPLSVNEVTNSPPLIISGGEGADLALAYPTDQVMWTRQQVPETSLGNSELVFVGYGINAPERDWNDYAGIDVKGKTVVILVNDPGALIP